VEAAPRLDRRAHDDELRAPLGGDARDFLAEAPRPRPDDLPLDADAVGADDRFRRLEPLLEGGEAAVHVRVQRQLPLDDERSHEDDAGAAIGREPAGEIERVLRLVAIEQRHDDAPVPDRARPAREAPGATAQHSDVREPHRMSW
jgi:hypothetical protein